MCKVQKHGNFLHPLEQPLSCNQEPLCLPIFRVLLDHALRLEVAVCCHLEPLEVHGFEGFDHCVLFIVGFFLLANTLLDCLFGQADLVQQNVGNFVFFKLFGVFFPLVKVHPAYSF